VSTAVESPTSEPSFYARKGIASWLLTTDHKEHRHPLPQQHDDVLTSLGMTLGAFMRLEHLTMGPTIMKPTSYNACSLCTE